MTYATKAQLIDRFGQTMLVKLTDRASPPAGTIDDAVIERALADTDALIDGFLAGRYRLPLAETPALLSDLAQQIAFYKLHVRSPDDKVKADYDGALKILEQIAKGTVRLNVEGVEPDASGATGVRATDRPRELTPETMKGFI